MNQRGFTLVELSIVLVILGLLIGGVLTGQTLIRAAELRSVTTQHQRWITAVQTFRDKYFALPGDMTNASSYWGAADGSTGSTAGCATTVSTTATTCNGNGNGILDSPTGSAEAYRFWQQLANAGLIEGSYNGVAGTGVTSANVAVGRLNSSLWFAASSGGFSGNSSFFDGPAGNYFEFGGLFASSDPRNGIMKPEEAYNIDMKIDDGKPGTGKMIIRDVNGFGNGAACSDAANSAGGPTASYKLTNTSPTCVLFFPSPF